MSKKNPNSKEPRQQPSIRARKALTTLVENGGSVGDAMRKAGYSPKTAKTPSKLLKAKAVKRMVSDIIHDMEVERDRAIRLMRSKISKARYRDLVDGADKMTKNIQLLSGKETENIKGSVIYLPGKKQ